MLSASPTAIKRSSLEEMLDSLRRRDEALEKSKDVPPALPVRPTSRARLPSARRSLPADFKVGANGQFENKIEEIAVCTGKEEISVCKLKEDINRKDKELVHKTGTFGSKKMRNDNDSVDSNPYVQHKNSHTEEHFLVPKLKVKKSNLDGNVAYFLQKKLQVWCGLPGGDWDLGHIQSISEDEAVVSLLSGKVIRVSTKELLPANPDILETVDDLMQLSYLNEPSVLHNLKQRYSKDIIYSKAGPVLIAINPFKEIPIYDDELIDAYKRKALHAPHVFGVADAAYSEMMRDGKSQSIIMSGESGAGKTQTAKHVMNFLATLGGDSSGIETKLPQANYILETFGNAKTTMNDNSSRFGKLLEIHFSESGKTCGAKIKTFLLEKSRVVQLAKGERSYHIFYQLCAGAPSSLKERLSLKMASEYNYLNQSECLVIDGVGDASKFHKLKQALNTIQINEEDQEQVFAMLATVLWLGNIKFQEISGENHVEVVRDEVVAIAAKLMTCSIEDMALTLSIRKIQIGNDIIAKKISLQQAIDRRDALAKFIYVGLFDWLVHQINKSLESGKPHTGRSINILDISGFESFKINSFEQFCINYADERLQQHLTRHLLRLPQEEYEEDGIEWTKVDFEDNQECLNLIENKPLGLLSLLDEESNFPKATDLTFANKLKQHLNCNPRFKGERGKAFSVLHYAGEVFYDTNGFREKNGDIQHSNFVQLLSSCTSQLPQSFASKPLSQAQHGGSESFMPSVGSSIKVELFRLMNHLENTTPHFVLCIKPNNNQMYDTYADDIVLQQMRCAGVLEVVRITRSGYATRMTHEEFASRYGFLLMGTIASQDPLSCSVAVLQQLNALPETYQVGYSKIYLRSSLISKLEEHRKQALEGFMGIQKCFHGRQDWLEFQEIKKGVITLQSFTRGENMRRNLSKMCTTGDPHIEDEQLAAIIYLQSVIRGWLVRKQLMEKYNFKQFAHEAANWRRKTGKKISEVKVMPQEQVDLQASILVEFEKRALKAETALAQKEEENAAMRERLQQFEQRWSEYEAKMKSMEEMWQTQMSSLQANLASARKSLAADSTPGQSGKLDITSPHYYDSEDNMSGGSRTPFMNTPSQYSVGGRSGRETNNGFSIDSRSGRETKNGFSIDSRSERETHNGTVGSVNDLVKEFEQRRQIYDDDAKILVEFRQSDSSNSNPYEELRRLRLRFESWKEDYKIRLREAKTRVHKLGYGHRRKWWEKIGMRGQ